MSTDQPSSKPDPEAASKRARPRDSMFLRGTMQVAGEGRYFDVRIRNLSAIGMMAEGAMQGSIGMTVIARLRGIGDVPGRIVWIEGNRMGIEFDMQIDPAAARQPVGQQKLDLPPYLKGPVGRRPGLRSGS